jgi:hypothetical protein
MKLEVECLLPRWTIAGKHSWHNIWFRIDNTEDRIMFLISSGAQMSRRATVLLKMPTSSFSGTARSGITDFATLISTTTSSEGSLNTATTIFSAPSTLPTRTNVTASYIVPSVIGGLIMISLVIFLAFQARRFIGTLLLLLCIWARDFSCNRQEISS